MQCVGVSFLLIRYKHLFSPQLVNSIISDHSLVGSINKLYSSNLEIVCTCLHTGHPNTSLLLTRCEMAPHLPTEILHYEYPVFANTVMLYRRYRVYSCSSPAI